MPIIRNIFVDTSIYRALNYNFVGPQLNRLVILTINRDVFLFTTVVTNEEVKARISEDVKKAEQAVIRLRKDAQIFRNLDTSPFKEFFTDYESEAAIQQLEGQFSKFLSDTKAEIIPLELASSKRVFQRYFAKRPPFGEGKKKNEFPDAFVLLSLENLCNKNDARMVVISTDPDMKAYCEISKKLSYKSTLAEFLDSITSLDEELSSYVRQLIRDNESLISDTISEQFTWLGFYLDDEDGDVEEVTVNSVKYNKTSVIEAKEDHALVEMQATVEFDADVVYQDYSNAMYDNEDKRFIGVDSKFEEVEDEAEINVEMSISYNLQEPTEFEIENVDVEPKGGGEVLVRLL